MCVLAISSVSALGNLGTVPNQRTVGYWHDPTTIRRIVDNSG